MDRKIIINNIKQQITDFGLEVAFKLMIKGNHYELVYKIYSKEVRGVPKLCDAVVVTFLAYAIEHELDFCSELPISAELYYKIMKHIIPQLSVCNNKENKISLNMPLSNETFDGKWVGTGISLGVDSLTTIHEYDEDSITDDYRLTHLVHLKTGAHHGSLGHFDKELEQKLFLLENNRVRKYCEEFGYNLITIETNLFEITNAEFGWNFDTTHIFRNLGCIVLLQNYFNKYYYASAYNLDAFGMSLNKPNAHYEKWLIPYLSNKSISFYSANEDMSRVEKTKYISKFEDTYNSLHVCWRSESNCGKCAKCIRTLVTLDILGVLDKYKNSFNVDEYYKNRDIYIGELILNRITDEHFNEIYEFAKANNMNFTRSVESKIICLKWCLRKFAEYGIIGVLKRVKIKLTHQI